MKNISDVRGMKSNTLFYPVGTSVRHKFSFADESEQMKEIQKMYLETPLAPGFLGGFVNWGYWKKAASELGEITSEERIEASKDLYRKVFEISEISHKDSVLEAGCGRGRGLFLLNEERSPAISFGLDLNRKFLDDAIRNNRFSNLSFIYGNACDIPIKRPLSQIICVEASQHFIRLEDFFKSSYSKLDDNGRLTIAGFFAPDKESLPYLENIGTIHKGVDLVKDLSTVQTMISRQGFKNWTVTSIGDRVIPQFEKWIQQHKYENMWSGGWDEAFEKKKIDYVIASCQKKSD